MGREKRICIKKEALGVPAIERGYKLNKITAESSQTVTLDGILLFLNNNCCQRLFLIVCWFF